MERLVIGCNNCEFKELDDCFPEENEIKNGITPCRRLLKYHPEYDPDKVLLVD